MVLAANILPARGEAICASTPNRFPYSPDCRPRGHWIIFGPHPSLPVLVKILVHNFNNQQLKATSIPRSGIKIHTSKV
jgi:hypothetical protein